MNGVIRRRGFGSDNTEVIEISNPKEITYTFTTTADNVQIRFGYFLNFYLSKVELDGVKVTFGGSDEQIPIPTAGHHVVRMFLKNKPDYSSDNYAIILTSFSFESVVLPYNFGSKYGYNGTYPIDVNFGGSNVEVVYFLDTIPFKTKKLYNNALSHIKAIYIPKGSKQAYISNGYPADKLIEVKYKYTL